MEDRRMGSRLAANRLTIKTKTTTTITRRLLRLSFLWLGIWAMAGCQSYVFDEKKSIANDHWNYADSIAFEFDITDKTKTYNVFLDVEHSKEYSFANLYCMLRVYFPDGRSRKEQVSLELADKLGTWLGKCSGEFCTRELPFMPNAVFEQAGKHRIVLEQYTRKDALEGLRSFRMRIEEKKVKG